MRELTRMYALHYIISSCLYWFSIFQFPKYWVYALFGHLYCKSWNTSILPKYTWNSSPLSVHLYTFQSVRWCVPWNNWKCSTTDIRKIGPQSDQCLSTFLPLSLTLYTALHHIFGLTGWFSDCSDYLLKTFHYFASWFHPENSVFLSLLTLCLCLSIEICLDLHAVIGSVLGGFLKRLPVVVSGS